MKHEMSEDEKGRMTGEKKTESVRMVLTCERCGTKSIVQQSELWRKEGVSKHPDFGVYSAVPQEVFSIRNAYEFDLSSTKLREEALLCFSCYDKYMRLRNRLLKAVNKRLLAFLEDEAL